LRARACHALRARACHALLWRSHSQGALPQPVCGRAHWQQHAAAGCAPAEARHRTQTLSGCRPCPRACCRHSSAGASAAGGA
jgi:hypothetical protein